MQPRKLKSLSSSALIRLKIGAVTSKHEFSRNRSAALPAKSTLASWYLSQITNLMGVTTLAICVGKPSSRMVKGSKSGQIRRAMMGLTCKGSFMGRENWSCLMGTSTRVVLIRTKRRDMVNSLHLTA